MSESLFFKTCFNESISPDLSLHTRHFLKIEQDDRITIQAIINKVFFMFMKFYFIEVKIGANEMILKDRYFYNYVLFEDFDS